MHQHMHPPSALPNILMQGIHPQFFKSDNIIHSAIMNIMSKIIIVKKKPAPLSLTIIATALKNIKLPKA